MARRYLFVLGAPDPEMGAIEALLVEKGIPYGYAILGGGQRVRPENAYQADGVSCSIPDDEIGIVTVECAVRGISPAVVVDHHRPGDPGYGVPSTRYLQGSSLGQVLGLLGVEPSDEHRLIAAADHCLAAAYRGCCPGVDPDALMRWRAASRAAFQKRPVEAVLADIEQAREALRKAQIISLAPNVQARDMRGRYVPELPEASAREGLCFVADGLPLPDGRVKIVCQSGTPAQIRAFMELWAPAQGLRDIYGDPERGFAGGYY